MSRDIKIDFIRFIGISLIILAHVSPPNWLFQLRNFDVPLMVIVSGYLYSMKNKKNTQFNLEYIIKRFKRLVIPVWIFLTVLFLIIFIYQPQMITSKLLITSFGLYSGIGYVWIIRVYLIIALFGEGLSRVVNKNLSIYLFIYLLYEILCRVKIPNLKISSVFENLVLVSVGYLLLFCYGTIFESLKIKKIKIVSIICLGTLCFEFLINKGLNLQYYKYPPRGVYFYYAILMFNIIFYLKEYLSKEKLEEIKIIGFVGKSTMWIYLWHIPFVLFIALLNKKGIKINYLGNYIIVFGGALIITALQNKFVDLIFVKENPKNKNIREVLLG